MSKLEKYISASDIKVLRKLQKAVLTKEITVTCVGLYNHGKSTLLNVLIKDFKFKTFKTADARETTQNKSIIYNNIKYVDTPGLNAKKDDDIKVLEAIQNSDITLFVHTITTGELNQKEIEFLEKIEKHWSNPEEFINRTIFILSRIDNIENYKDIAKTSKRMKEQIKKIFSCNCLISPVSAMDYRDGMVDNENELVRESNIKELENLIENLLTKESRDSMMSTKQKRVEDKLNELNSTLNHKIKKNRVKIDKFKKEQERIDKEFKSDITKIESTLKSMYSRLS